MNNTADFVNKYLFAFVALILSITTISSAIYLIKASNEKTDKLERAYKYKIIQHDSRPDYGSGIYYTNSFEVDNKAVKFIDEQGKDKVLIGDNITIVEN